MSRADRPRGNAALHLVREMVRHPYSHSPAWLGFFETPELDARHLDEVLSLFRRFREELGPPEAVGALAHASRHPKGVVRSLVRAGAVHTDDWEREWFWALDVDPSPDFEHLPMDPGLIDTASAWVMRHKLPGHLFFAWLEQEVVVYPHVDYGFGALARTEEGVEAAVGFLESALQPGRFTGRIHHADSVITFFGRETTG